MQFRLLLVLLEYLTSDCSDAVHGLRRIVVRDVRGPGTCIVLTIVMKAHRRILTS